MKLLKRILIFFLIKLIACHILKNVDARAGLLTENRVRRKFGFVCLNDKEFKICQNPPQIDYSLVDTIFECEVGFICDENNPQFCSPYKCSNCGNNENENDNLKLLERLASLSDSELDDYDDFLSNLMEMLKKNEKDQKIENFKSTSGIDSYYLNCEGNQLLPDKNNPRMFWYCNKRSSGKIELAHMFCGMNQIFDPRISACRIVSPNNSCLLKDDDSNGYILDPSINEFRPENTLSEDSPRIRSELFKKPFICDINVDGKKLRDENDCHLYHICFDDNYAPLKEITFTCPDKTAFDPQCQKCTASAVVKYCKPADKPCKTLITKTNNTNNSENLLKLNFSTDDSKNCHIVLHNTICQIPFVFRESSECSFYYICRVDKIYKMKCPPDFLFDDYHLMCLPKHKAHCIIQS